MSMSDVRAKPRARFQFNVQKHPMLESSGVSLPKKSHLDPKPDGCQGCKKSTGGISTSTTDSLKKGSHGDGTPDVPKSPSSSSVVQLVPFLTYWISGEALLVIDLCLT